MERWCLRSLLKIWPHNLIEINVDDDFPEPVAVSLSLGKKLTIKVVDPEGNPISNAWIPVDTWRGHRSLADAKLPSRTNKKGVFCLEECT